MTDKYADLRAALDAGPKPGRWTWKQVGSFNTPGCAVFWPDTSKGGIHYRRLDSGGGMEQVDAGYIAAANPETIRALLAERDDVLENGDQAVRWAPSSAYWSNELKRLFGEDAREGIDALEAQLRAAQSERDALREALRLAANWISAAEHRGDDCWGGGYCCCGKHEIEKTITAALAQEGA